MVTNVLNSRDDRLVNSFFHRVCYSNCTFTDDIPRLFGVAPEIVYDLDTMINFINLDPVIYPDCIMILKQAQIIQNEQLQGGSKIVLCYEMKGTKVFENVQDQQYQLPHRIPQLMNESVDDSSQPGKIIVPMKDHCTTNKETTKQPVQVQHLKYDTTYCTPLPQPRKVQTCPKISITLNAENIAYAVEYSLVPGSEIIETPLDKTFKQLSIS
jgi:hypothetical protein